MSKILLPYDSLRTIGPIRQMLAVMVVTLASIALWSTFSQNPEVEWFIGNAALGFFSWMNIVLYFFRKHKQLAYLGLSILSFFFLATVLFFTAQFFSTVNISDAREYRTMFMATIVFYTCGIMIVTLIKNVAILFGIDDY
ncbi:MAG: hypothetical protein ACPGXL_01530 [Chitinophagales bacterium]